MSEENTSNRAPYEFYGKMPLKQAIPLGLQHVLAMFVGNLTPLLIICGACGISGSEEFAHLQVSLLQNAMFVAGVVTLVQLYAIGPIGGKVPIIMGTSSGSAYLRVSQIQWAAELQHTVRSWERRSSEVSLREFSVLLSSRCGNFFHRS